MQVPNRKSLIGVNKNICDKNFYDLISAYEFAMRPLDQKEELADREIEINRNFILAGLVYYWAITPRGQKNEKNVSWL